MLSGIALAFVAAIRPEEWRPLETLSLPDLRSEMGLPAEAPVLFWLKGSGRNTLIQAQGNAAMPRLMIAHAVYSGFIPEPTGWRPASPTEGRPDFVMGAQPE